MPALVKTRTIRPTPTPIAFRHLEGHCYILPLPDLVHQSDGPFRSRSEVGVSLWEDDRGIGDQTPFVMDVISKGRGAYLHFGDVLLFSASDNSNPNENGRVYEL